MKKTGFTLAEVLVTLTIIGVISALTLPTMLSNYQAKTVGVKLSKFVNQIETASLPFVSDNNVLTDINNISNFINKSFIFKDILNANGNSTSSMKYEVFSNSSIAQTAVLKDDTSFKVLMSDDLDFNNHSNRVDVAKVGSPSFEIVFNPAVKGLSSALQSSYSFVVTELGYVYPKDNDNCLWAIYENGYTTTQELMLSACQTRKNNTNTDIEDELSNIKGNIGENIKNNFNNFSKDNSSDTDNIIDKINNDYSKNDNNNLQIK